MAKLIRDKIPDFIKADNKVPRTHIATDDEYWQALKNKLQEEVREFLESEEKEELADIYEVLLAIHKLPGFSQKEIEALRIKKSQSRGGFAQRIILDNVK